MPTQPSLFAVEHPTIGVIDLETTGFLNQKGLIVELGIVSLNLNTGEIKTEFESLIKEPGFNTAHAQPPYGWIFENSSLRYEDVEKASSMKSLFAEIQATLSGFSGVTAYNTAFDFPFLRARSFTFTALPCPMIAATPLVNLPPAGNRDEPKWPSVQETWDFLFGNTGYVESHRALDDAIHEAKIIYELFKRGVYTLTRG